MYVSLKAEEAVGSFGVLFLRSSVMIFIPLHAASSLFISDLISSIDWLVGDIDVAAGGDG